MLPALTADGAAAAAALPNRLLVLLLPTNSAQPSSWIPLFATASSQLLPAICLTVTLRTVSDWMHQSVAAKAWGLLRGR